MLNNSRNKATSCRTKCETKMEYMREDIDNGSKKDNRNITGLMAMTFGQLVW